MSTIKESNFTIIGGDLGEVTIDGGWYRLVGPWTRGPSNALPGFGIEVTTTCPDGLNEDGDLLVNGDFDGEDGWELRGRFEGQPGFPDLAAEDDGSRPDGEEVGLSLAGISESFRVDGSDGHGSIPHLTPAPAERTLRDRFAEKAMEVLLQRRMGPFFNNPDAEAIARDAFLLADAMLAARGGSEGR